MKCECSQSKLMPSMLQNCLPYSHLFFQGMIFPDNKPSKHNMVNLLKGKFFFEYQIIYSLKVVENSHYYENCRKYFNKIIKKYSYCKRIILLKIKNIVRHVFSCA